MYSTPWKSFPKEGIEHQATTAYLKKAYPSFFINGSPGIATTGDIKTGSASPPNPRVDTEGEAVQFGDIVSNLRDIFTFGFQKENAKKLPVLVKKLPNWNLDADRGLAFPTWRFAGDVPTEGAVEANPVLIEQES